MSFHIMLYHIMLYHVKCVISNVFHQMVLRLKVCTYIHTCIHTNDVVRCHMVVSHLVYQLKRKGGGERREERVVGEREREEVKMVESIR